LGVLFYFHLLVQQVRSNQQTYRRYRKRKKRLALCVNYVQDDKHKDKEKDDVG
jgi:hypothetical protein